MTWQDEQKKVATGMTRGRAEDDDDIQDYKKPWVDLTPVEKAAIWSLPQDQWIDATAKLLKDKNT